jgi:hypothetical protein
VPKEQSSQGFVLKAQRLRVPMGTVVKFVCCLILWEPLNRFKKREKKEEKRRKKSLKRCFFRTLKERLFGFLFSLGKVSSSRKQRSRLFSRVSQEEAET